MPDQYGQVCGYDRKDAIKRLAADPLRPRRKAGRKPRYDKELLLPVLKRVWLASDQMCSKRLRAALPKWLPHRSPLSAASRAQLLALSPATLDRLLQPLRVRYPGKGLGGTKPGTRLKHHPPSAPATGTSPVRVSSRPTRWSTAATRWPAISSG